MTGRPEVWQGIRAALEVLWEADRRRRAVGGASSEEDSSEDVDGGADLALATAQSILDAADVTLPTGDLVDGVYDLLGNYYQLAECVVCDPVDVEDNAGAGEEEVKMGVDGGEDETEEERDARRRREEKGKSVVDRRSLVAIVMRLSDSGRDLKMKVGKEEGVGSVVRRVREETGVSFFFLRWCVSWMTNVSLQHSPQCRIRLVHAGKIMRENASLAEQGWVKGNVLSAFVYDPPDGQPPGAT